MMHIFSYKIKKTGHIPHFLKWVDSNNFYIIAIRYIDDIVI